MQILIVEDDENLFEALRFDSRSWPGSVLPAEPLELRNARTQSEALAALAHRPDVVLLDVQLAEGNGVEVVRAAVDLFPRPLFVAMSGKASAREGFELAQLGVRAYLAKPFTPEELRHTLREAWRLREQDNALTRTAVAQIGQQSIHVVQDQIRSEMLREALARTDWNYTRTAKLLGVSRQAVQQMMDRFELSRADRVRVSS
jgi:two-component system, response regulator RegA